MKHTIAVTFLVGAGLALSGCQSPMLGGFSVWNRNNSVAGSTAPDVGKQKYSGLSQQLSPAKPATTGMGGNHAPADTGFFASWKKATASFTGASAVMTGWYCGPGELARAASRGMVMAQDVRSRRALRSPHTAPAAAPASR